MDGCVVRSRKLSLLELAKDLGNVSKACKVMGYSRQQFYEIRRNYQTFGVDGLQDKLPGCKGSHPNRVSAEIEQAIPDHSPQYPTHGPVWVVHELALRGITVSSGGVRGVWSRHDLLSRHDRLLRPDQTHRETAFELSAQRLQLLERFSPEFRERQIEVHYSGDLVAVDTFFVGTLKGVGKIYLQTVLDCYSRFAWGRLYTSKLPVTAVHVLNEDVLPFFEDHNAVIDTVLSGNGREFCGWPDQHPYELFLQLEGIVHRTTRVRRPQSNGFIERLHRTLLDEHFRVKGRTTWYETVEQMQVDLKQYLHHYKYERPHQGRMMGGRTPYAMFTEGLSKRPVICESDAA